MPKPIPELRFALSTLRAQLLITESRAKSVAGPMQQLLAIEIEAYTKRLENWALTPSPDESIPRTTNWELYP